MRRLPAGCPNAMRAPLRVELAAEKNVLMRCNPRHGFAPRPRRPGLPSLEGDSMVGTIARDIGTLLAIEHVVLLPATLLRRDEYSGHTHHHGPAGQPLAARPRGRDRLTHSGGRLRLLGLS
jgi:hypothetical protein